MRSILTLLLLFTTIAAYCQENAGQDKRSTILEADGYVYLSDDKTLGKIKNEAMISAKRNALENAQTYIKSQSTVENFELTYDFVSSGAEGSVQVLESKDYGIEEGRYHVWIKAEVVYSMKTPETENRGIKIKSTAGKTVDLPGPEYPLTIALWTDKENYAVNEKIRIHIQGNKSFYVKVIYIDAGGTMLQLLPNQYRKENYFSGEKTYNIPDLEDEFELEVSGPFGEESIFVFASTEPLGDTDLEDYGTVYGVKGTKEDFGVKSRGVKIKKKPAEFYESECIITTSDK
ncbi:MAG: DUF4384 domain-containing protein [candidate division Zixibacteria bacterium]|nr:DUF4384 domain-containing protein [Candidatus Tariuqbacter arcticus]